MEGKKKEFLLEVGVEEIPAWMIPATLDNFRDLLVEKLKTNRLADEDTPPPQMFATPRRLVAYCPQLPARQPAREELVQGPPERIAFDADGNPTPAGIKFAEKMGTRVGDLETVATPKGDYLSARKVDSGLEAFQILKDLIPVVIQGIYFPRTMYWEGKSGPHFIRPIRNLVALLDGRVIPCSLGSVKAGRYSFGHRRLGKPRISVKSFSQYRESLAANGVLLDPEERRARIQGQIDFLLRMEKDYRLKENPELLSTLVHLTEHPTPLIGSFDPSYLSLPEEVLITVMRGHQKYFAVEDANGKLAPRFIAVMETDADTTGVIRNGHERVLRARFNDAQFFWKVDGKTTLANRLERLRNVTFQSSLGSYFEKVDRMQQLALHMVRALQKNGVQMSEQDAQTAARLSKSDLTTDLVKEFTELQGVVGGLAANREELPAAVGLAIYDHYKPQSMEDSLPRSREGDVVSLADRLDTLVGCFGVGLIPTGSKDPFGLRRAAQGVIRILAEQELPLDLRAMVGEAETIYTSAKANGHHASWKPEPEALFAFLDDRLRYYLRETHGFPYDEVNAVLTATAGFTESKTSTDVTDILHRLRAVHEIRSTADFEPLAAAFKRMKNILQQAGKEQEFTPSTVQDELLESRPEKKLYEHFGAISEAVSRHKEKRDYLAALREISSLRADVDHFFDTIMVMVPDLQVRGNRLSLLAALFTEFSTIADFSEIVPDEKGK